MRGEVNFRIMASDVPQSVIDEANNAINDFAQKNTTGIDVDDRINAYLLQEAGGIVNEENVRRAFDLVKTECYIKIAERKS